MKLLQPEKHFVIVAYDIVNNRRRNRIFKKLKGLGFPMQKSVFECLLTDEQIRRMTQVLKKELDDEKDTIRIYVLPLEFKEHLTILGTGDTLQDPPVIIV